MRWPLLSNAKPKGVAPLDAYDVTPRAMPFASTVNVSMRLVVFSVTTRTCPVGSNETCAGTAPALSACVDPAMGVRTPPDVSQKPEIEPPDPPFTTYTRLSWTAMLIGVVPPEATLVTHVRPEALTWNEASWCDPAFHREEDAPVFGEDHSSLAAEPRTCSCAARREAAGEGQTPVRRPGVPQ